MTNGVGRWVRSLLLLLVLFVVVGSCGTQHDTHTKRPTPRSASYAGKPLRVAGLEVPAQADSTYLRLAIDGSFRPRFWPGVNIGSAVPGTFPGQVAATRSDYDRWLAQCADLGVRVVRVYTILRPAFYDAIVAFNVAHPQVPIYVIHGVWIPEEEFTASQDAWAPKVTSGFRRELRDAVAVVHGDARLPFRRGHASGTYTADISRWLLAWSIGVEWDPIAVHATDRKHAGMHPFAGRYFVATSTATPMESWITGMLDYTASLEQRRGWSRPMTFTNWLTVDPLPHPTEPLPREDLVSVDAMHIRATHRWPGGFFASYHAYPYYPDFLSTTPAYQRYVPPGATKPDPFAGYLADLRRHHHGQAVMITEFGQPTSLGIAHRGPLGRDQGDHSESEALGIDAQLLAMIRKQGFAGGLVFELSDEWFKFTWNTIDYELPPERRALWRNVLTNEEHFGLLASEPDAEPVAVVDGKDDEWHNVQSLVLQESRSSIREVRATKDAAYLYLRVRLDDSFDAASTAFDIGLDVRPGGNHGLPGRVGVAPNADVAVRVGPGRRANLKIAAATDPLLFQYGLLRHYVPVRAVDLRPGSGAWSAPRLILNRPYRIPGTREVRPVETFDISKLRIGTADPRSAGYDNRTLVGMGHNVVELRLPWALLGYADPSSLRVVVPHPDGSITTAAANPRIGFTFAVDGEAPVNASPYGWDIWQRVTWHERRKQGWSTMRRALTEASAAP